MQIALKVLAWLALGALLVGAGLEFGKKFGRPNLDLEATAGNSPFENQVRDQKRKAERDDDLELSTMACIKAERAVKERLKAPATAQFPSCSRQEVRASPDRSTDRSTVFVKGYVDSQNSFGAMLRSKFVVQFKRDTDRWTVLAAAIE